jgi:hypothetical protein
MYRSYRILRADRAGRCLSGAFAGDVLDGTIHHRDEPAGYGPRSTKAGTGA